LVKKAAVLLGFALFAVAFPAWFWRAIEVASYENTFILTVVAVPIFEELSKYIAYRGMKFQWTIIVPIVFLTTEFINGISTGGTPNGMYDPIYTGAVYLTNFTLLKHLLFWAPQKLFGFKWWTIPIAIVGHSLWNVYILLPSGPDGPIAALLAIFTVFFALMLFREDAQTAK